MLQEGGWQAAWEVVCAVPYAFDCECFRGAQPFPPFSPQIQILLVRAQVLLRPVLVLVLVLGKNVGALVLRLPQVNHPHYRLVALPSSYHHTRVA